jgi:hypothetical protein
MRKKFWDYMNAPTPKGLIELTDEEQAFAETLAKKDKWPDGQKKGGTPTAGYVKPKAK